MVGWGSNTYGMLGDGTGATSRLTATPVFALSHVTGLAGGTYHVLAVDDQGSVWAWGNNASNELGNPSAGTTSNVPVQVPNLGGVAQVFAGNNYSFALKSNGELFGWGANRQALGVTDAGVDAGTGQTLAVPWYLAVP